MNVFLAVAWTDFRDVNAEWRYERSQRNATIALAAIQRSRRFEFGVVISREMDLVNLLENYKNDGLKRGINNFKLYMARTGVRLK